MSVTDLLNHHLYHPYPREFSFLVVPRQNYLDVGGIDADLPVGELIQLSLKLLDKFCGDSGYASDERAPALIRKSLGDVWERRLDHAQLRQLYYQHVQKIYQPFFTTKQGVNYRFQETEIIEACIDRIEVNYPV